MKLEIIYEDNHLIAVNKPAGWLVQGDITGDKPISDEVKAYIKERYKKPGDVYLGLIHRLDRPVSGVVIFARTSKALTRMNKLFQDREMKKKYWAITAVRPDPLEGHLTHYLLKDTTVNKTKAFDRLSNKAKNAKKSELDYFLKAGLAGHHLLEINPLTGRPHQIRAQLAKIGCPIRGDLKYGYDEPNKNGSIHLHCREMSFIHPVKKEPVTIRAEVPKDQIWRLFDL
jgi:23S rRNA pseudouridine1911/1915/1917 synthase